MVEISHMQDGEAYDEAEVLARAKLGDAEAVGRLFVEHGASVRRLLRSVMGPIVDLDDLTQEVFLSAHRSLPRFRGDSKLSTWLHRLAVHTAISHMRKNKRRPLTTSLEASELTRANDRPNGEDDVHGRVQARRRVKRLYELLDTLSPKRRAAFVLFEIENNSLSDLARLMGVSKATAKSRVWFARREIFKKAGDDPVLGPLLEELRR